MGLKAKPREKKNTKKHKDHYAEGIETQSLFVAFYSRFLSLCVPIHPVQKLFVV